MKTRRSVKSQRSKSSEADESKSIPKKKVKNRHLTSTGIYAEKETQVNLEDLISAEDLIGEPSESYWKCLAKKQEKTLSETLSTNEELVNLVAELRKQLDETKTMLDEANSFIEVIKEEIQREPNDSGVDVNTSCADQSSNSDLGHSSKESD